MSALSIRNRFEWASVGLIIGAAFFYVTYYMYVNEGTSAGLACWFTGILGVFFIRQSLFDTPNISLKRWWENFSRPATVGTFESKSVFERWVFSDFRYIYNHTDCLIAYEQTIDWSSTDPDWRCGDPEDIQVIVTRCDGSERLPWLARLRSPKLPKPQAEVLAADGDVVGYTEYKML